MPFLFGGFRGDQPLGVFDGCCEILLDALGETIVVVRHFGVSQDSQHGPVQDCLKPSLMHVIEAKGIIGEQATLGISDMLEVRPS